MSFTYQIKNAFSVIRKISELGFTSHDKHSIKNGKNPIFSSSDEILYCHSRSLPNVDFIKCKNVLPLMFVKTKAEEINIYTLRCKKSGRSNIIKISHE